MVLQKTKPVKTYAGLLVDLFNEYRPIYKNETYEAYTTSSDKSNCLRLSNENVVDFNAPTLALKKWGEDINHLELSLFAFEPQMGFSERFPPKLFSLYINNGGNKLLGSASRSFGGLGELIVFEQDDVHYNDLIIELIKKTNALIATGLYGLQPQPVLFS